MNLNKFFIIYKLDKTNDVENFTSKEMRDAMQRWEMISTQIFEHQNQLYVSVLWNAQEEDEKNNPNQNQD